MDQDKASKPLPLCLYLGINHFRAMRLSTICLSLSSRIIKIGKANPIKSIISVVKIMKKPIIIIHVKHVVMI